MIFSSGHRVFDKLPAKNWLRVKNKLITFSGSYGIDIESHDGQKYALLCIIIVAEKKILRAYTFFSS